MAFEKEKLSFLAILTLGVVTVFIGTLVYGMISELIPVKEFIAQLGTMAGMLLGYWIRDNKE